MRQVVKEFRHIGKAAPRLAAREFVTGKAKYIRDIKRPRMLYGKVLRSPYAHALIKNIDTSKAEALAGIKAVLTHKNVPDWYLGIPIPHARILDSKVRYVGDAVALAAARLRKAEEEIHQRKMQLASAGEKISDANESGFKIKSKAIILLTDGINNAGQYDPLEAAELAKKWGIKIYTIGIGSAQAFTTVQMLGRTYKMPAGQNLDERLLKTIAENTGGFYGRADDAKALRSIVERIDELEKTEVKSVQYTQFAERFGLWTLAALLVLGAEMLVGCTVFRKIP